MTIQEAATTQRYVRNRSRLDVIAAILRVLNDKDASKTRIMYGAYVSYAQIRGYIPSMLASGLLTITNGQHLVYRIKERGIRFLQLYERLNEMIATHSPLQHADFIESVISQTDTTN